MKIVKEKIATCKWWYEAILLCSNKRPFITRIVVKIFEFYQSVQINDEFVIRNSACYFFVVFFLWYQQSTNKNYLLKDSNNTFQDTSYQKQAMLECWKNEKISRPNMQNL